jgi:iron(III) transport system substrate-binding protein
MRLSSAGAGTTAVSNAWQARRVLQEAEVDSMGQLRRLSGIGGSVALVLTLAACGGEADTEEPVATNEADGEAASEDDDGGAVSALDAVCERGAEEGSFEYWATFEDENWQRIYEPFAERYPGIAIQLLGARGSESLQRMVTAQSAGQAQPASGISSGMDELIGPAAERGLVDTDVDWLELDIPEELIDAETNSIRLSRTAIGLAYNAETTSPDELPDTWEELIDERFAGQVVVDPRGRPFHQLAMEWGEEAMTDYVQRLMDVVQPVVIEGGTAGMTAVLTGEALMTTGGRSDSTLELTSQGAPIAMKYLDIIPTEHDYNALVAEAQSPDAATCFIGWLSSPEGTAIYQEVEFKTNETIPEGAPDDALYVSVTTAEEAEQANEYAEVARRIIEGN